MDSELIDAPGTFVTVGNAKQPFARLLGAIASLIDILPAPVLVQHGHTGCPLDGCHLTAFMQMAEFERAVGSARVLITHGGAGSVLHALRAGKRPVVMPRVRRLGEHVDDHQVEFVQALASRGKVLIAQSESELRAAVERTLAEEAAPHALAAGPSPLCIAVAERIAAHVGGRVQR